MIKYHLTLKDLDEEAFKEKSLRGILIKEEYPSPLELPENAEVWFLKKSWMFMKSYEFPGYPWDFSIDFVDENLNVL